MYVESSKKLFAFLVLFCQDTPVLTYLARFSPLTIIIFVNFFRVNCAFIYLVRGESILCVKIDVK